jgi:DNA polymerase-3 subunit epsilon
MSIKALYFDVETTGRSAYKNDIVQLSGMVEIDGEVKETFNLLARPVNVDDIEQEALDVIGKTKEQIMKYPDRSEMKKQFQDILGRYVNKFDKADKFIPVGYNVRFDLDFIHSFFKKQKDMYLGSFISWYYVDVMALANLKAFEGAFKLENHKLGTLCDHFGIQIQAHDALSDIVATRDLLGALTGRKLNPITKEPTKQATQQALSSDDISNDIPF